MTEQQPGPHTQVEVSRLPKCDFCKAEGKDTDAEFDGRTNQRVWAYMCLEHFIVHGNGLGLGKGQKLILRKETAK